MIYFSKRIALFMVFSLCAYLILLIIWGDWVQPTYFKKNLNYKLGLYGFMNSRIKEVRQIRNVDILFLGSSHAYRGFDTRIFNNAGFSAFNLGSSSQSPIQTDILLGRYLDRLNPKVVIYEVNPILFVSDGVESALDLIANDSLGIDMLNSLVAINDLRVYNTCIYASYRQSFFKDKNFKEEKNKDGDLYVEGGYVEKFKFNDEDLVALPPDNEINVNQLNKFADVIGTLLSRDIKLILINAPVTSEYAEHYDKVKNFDSLMISYGDYYNWSRVDYLYDSVHFYDDQHMNQTGVNIFNQEILNRLLGGRVE